MRGPWQDPSGSDRVSELDRQRALADIENFASQGIIRGDEERRLRERKVRLALTRDQLDAALIDLPGGKKKAPSKGDLRASDAERQEAVRRIGLYETQGYLDQAAAATRVKLVEASITSNEIAAVFVDLPVLGTKSPLPEERISAADRLEASELLKTAWLQDRITKEELDMTLHLIDSARGRAEIDEAMFGLTKLKRELAVDHAAQVAKDAVTATGRTIKAGSRRVVSAILRGALAFALLIAGIIAAITIGGIVWIAFLAGAVIASAWSLWALFGPRKSRLST